MLLYIDKIPLSIRTQFEQRLREVATWLAVDPNWLMQVMYAESKLVSSAANRAKDGHLVAAGILQFTAASGIVKSKIVSSLDAILHMNHVQQIELVRWYFAPQRGRMHSYYDVYLQTFFPLAIGKPDSWVLQAKDTSAAKVAQQNPGIAKGKSQITVADFKQYVLRTVPAAYHASIFGRAVDYVADTAKSGVKALAQHKESAKRLPLPLQLPRFFFSSIVTGPEITYTHYSQLNLTTHE